MHSLFSHQHHILPIGTVEIPSLQPRLQKQWNHLR